MVKRAAGFIPRRPQISPFGRMGGYAMSAWVNVLLFILTVQGGELHLSFPQRGEVFYKLKVGDKVEPGQLLALLFEERPPISMRDFELRVDRNFKLEYYQARCVDCEYLVGLLQRDAAWMKQAPTPEGVYLNYANFLLLAQCIQELPHLYAEYESANNAYREPPRRKIPELTSPVYGVVVKIHGPSGKKFDAGEPVVTIRIEKPKKE
jgi:hypothetical protein